MMRNPGNDALIGFLNKIIRLDLRLVAFIMPLVIIWGVADIVYLLHHRLMAPLFLLLEISDFLATFGVFMAVLIAIEIYYNIVLYPDEQGNQYLAVEIAIATALMAVAHKVIVLDFKEASSDYVLATAAVALALVIGYCLITRLSRTRKPQTPSAPLLSQ